MSERLTSDRLKPLGLGRSKLSKLLDEHERLAALSKAAGERFRDARMARQALPNELARRASEAATAGEDVDLTEHATDADTALLAAQSNAKGTEDARVAALGKVGAFLRSEDRDEIRAKVAHVLEERRTVALEKVEAAVAAIDDLAEAVAVAEAFAERPAGVTPTLTVPPPERHPLHRQVEELAAQVVGAGPKEPARQPVPSAYTARLGA